MNDTTYLFIGGSKHRRRECVSNPSIIIVKVPTQTSIDYGSRGVVSTFTNEVYEPEYIVCGCGRRHIIFVLKSQVQP